MKTVGVVWGEFSLRDTPRQAQTLRIAARDRSLPKQASCPFFNYYVTIMTSISLHQFTRGRLRCVRSSFV